MAIVPTLLTSVVGLSIRTLDSPVWDAGLSQIALPQHFYQEFSTICHWLTSLHNKCREALRELRSLHYYQEHSTEAWRSSNHWAASHSMDGRSRVNEFEWPISSRQKRYPLF